MRLSVGRLFSLHTVSFTKDILVVYKTLIIEYLSFRTFATLGCHTKEITLAKVLCSFILPMTSEGYFELNAEYANFLIQKISFHNKHPQFKGSFSTEDIVEKRKMAEDTNALEIVNHMMDLQQSIYSVQRALFAQKNIDDVNSYCLVLLVVESYNLYSWETHLITKLVDSNFPFLSSSVSPVTAVLQKWTIWMYCLL